MFDNHWVWDPLHSRWLLFCHDCAVQLFDRVYLFMNHALVLTSFQSWRRLQEFKDKFQFLFLILTKVATLFQGILIISGGSKGAPTSSPACHTHGPKFSQFHAVFRKIWQSHMLATPPPDGLCPPLRESWIRPLLLSKCRRQPHFKFVCFQKLSNLF